MSRRPRRTPVGRPTAARARRGVWARAGPGNSYPGAASGSAAQCCRRACPSASAGTRCARWCAPGCARSWPAPICAATSASITASPPRPPHAGSRGHPRLPACGAATLSLTTVVLPHASDLHGWRLDSSPTPRPGTYSAASTAIGAFGPLRAKYCLRCPASECARPVHPENERTPARSAATSRPSTPSTASTSLASSGAPGLRGRAVPRALRGRPPARHAAARPERGAALGGPGPGRRRHRALAGVPARRDRPRPRTRPDPPMRLECEFFGLSYRRVVERWRLQADTACGDLHVAGGESSSRWRCRHPMCRPRRRCTASPASNWKCAGPCPVVRWLPGSRSSGNRAPSSTLPPRATSLPTPRPARYRAPPNGSSRRSRAWRTAPSTRYGSSRQTQARTAAPRGKRPARRNRPLDKWRSTSRRRSSHQRECISVAPLDRRQRPEPPLRLRPRG